MRFSVRLSVALLASTALAGSASAQVKPTAGSVGAIPLSSLGQPNGPASLGTSGTLPAAQIPFGTTPGTVASGAVDPIARSAVQPGGDVSTNTVTATGGTTARTAAAQAADVINVASYGPLACDGTTDDSGTINAAMAAFRTAQNARSTAHLVFPKVGSGRCLVKSPINATMFRGIGGLIDGNGATIVCATSGGACFDNSGSAHVTYNGLTIEGSQTNPSALGLQLARVSSTVDCVEQTFNGLVVYGYFTKAAYLNESCEVDTFNKTHIENSYSGAYTALMDGANHWGATSPFVTISILQDSQQSYNENTWNSPTFVNYGGGRLLWMERTNRHKFIGAYGLQTQGTSPAVALYDGSVGSNVDIDFDMHFETGPSDIFLLSGPNASPALSGFRYRDHAVQSTNSIFKLDTGVSSASMPGADIHAASFVNSGVKVFDNPAAWTGSGAVYVPAAAYWNSPSLWFGCAFIAGGGSCLPQLGSGLVYNAATNTISVSLPSTLAVNTIAASGGVSSLKSTASGLWSIPAGGNLFPTLAISAPPQGGTQAAAHVKSLLLNGYGSITNGGTGYVSGCYVSLQGGTAEDSAVSYQVTASNGAITSLAYSSGGHYSSLIPDLTSVNVTNITCNGSGATVHGLSWSMPSGSYPYFAVDASGSGYTSATATFGTQSGVTLSSGAPTASVQLSNSLTETGGAGQILLDATGTKLGVNGASGSPAIAQGALIKGATASSSPATGATIAAAANTDSYGVLGSSTLSTLTFKLPALTGTIGQDFVIDFVPAVTTLTVQTASGGAVATTSASATTPKRFKSFDGSTWTMVQ